METGYGYSSTDDPESLKKLVRDLRALDRNLFLTVRSARLRHRFFHFRDFAGQGKVD
jgi:hypothetical protein